MADVGTILTERLADDATIAGIVGARVGPEPAPQAANTPAITYRRSSGVKLAGMVTNLGMATPVFEISCWATTYTRAHELAEAVKDCLERWEDLDADPAILDAVELNEEDDYEPETRLYRVTLDFEIWHRTA